MSIQPTSFGEGVWADVAQRKDYTFGTGPCECWRCKSPPPPESFWDKLKSLLCPCLSSTSVDIPPAMLDQSKAALGLPNTPPPPIFAGANCPYGSYMLPRYNPSSAPAFDPKAAKKLIEKQKEMIKAAEKAAKVHAKAAKKAREESTKQAMKAEKAAHKQYQAHTKWALKHGMQSVPPNAFFTAPGVAHGIRRPQAYRDGYGAQYPLMSGTMMQAVRSQNQEEYLANMASGQLWSR